jgi:hypothetical protein
MSAMTLALPSPYRDSIFSSSVPPRSRAAYLVEAPGSRWIDHLISRKEEVTRSWVWHLSTIVEDFMWISVYILQNNSLGSFFVDKWWIEPVTYPQLVHSPDDRISNCKCQAQKKKLDQLSTYPQSLLYLLFYKIYLKQDMNI